MSKGLWWLIGLIIVIAFFVLYAGVNLSPDPEDETIVCVDERPDESWITPFREYLKENENDQRRGRGRDGLWRPIDSPEGGQEICYGHKLQPGEPPIILDDGTELYPPLTDEECDDVLESDIQKHIDRVLEDDRVREDMEEYGVEWLTAEQIMIFTDYEYTGVLGKFPKFRRGILLHDWDLACDEYKRYYTPPGSNERRPLERRNIEFCCNFLAEHDCDCGTDEDGNSVCNEDNDYGFP